MTQTLETIAEQIKSGRLDDARRSLKSAPETVQNQTELLFLKGYLQELSYEREAAAATYQRVVDKDPSHTESVFRLALLCDQAGDDTAALNYYQKCASEQPVHVNALINLALLFEERGRWTEAESCLKTVLAAYPNHRRARHFLESVESSKSMLIDERSQREREHHYAVLDVPISDFELSVRSRNCLRQMNIRTLGDLLRTSEADLLSYKNFGETSLNEVKALLSQKSLSLGQALQPVEKPVRSVSMLPTGDGSQYLNKPITELELSVRSRKCLQWLGVSTLGDLAGRSESELMSTKNFGQTSLQEIKRQMALYGLSFAK